MLTAGLLLRRALEAAQVRRSSRWRAESLTTAAAPATTDTGRHRLVCVVPVYLEQEIAEETARFWHGLALQNLFDQVLLVSTAKEQAASGQTTHELIEAELQRLGADPKRIALLRCEEVTRFRASQLNLAVESARARLDPADADPSALWVGIYNADSRPEAGTFEELRARALAEPRTRVFQQLVYYVVPERGRAGMVAIGNSVLQTWWTLSHYVGRNSRGLAGDTVWSRTSPYSTFGHGEFIRLDLLDHIGGFPDFAYADGLLLGWICRLAGEPIGLLANIDVAEVPRSARDLVTQQTAWLTGLLNFGATVRWCRERGVLRLPSWEARLMQAQHLTIPVAWGLSTIAVTSAIGSAVRRTQRGGSAARNLTLVAGLVAYPVIPALAPVTQHGAGISLGRRVSGTLASWPVEGLAFWPALRGRMRRGQLAPAKTPR